MLLGVDELPILGVVCCDSVEGGASVPVLEDPLGDFAGVSGVLFLLVCFASRCSNVPRSVLSPSSSLSRPDSLSNDSIRPRRFSRPSMYFALLGYQLDIPISRESSRLPFRLSSLLLHLCENAFRLVVFAVRTFGQFCIALDFLLTAHITGLQYAYQHVLGT